LCVVLFGFNRLKKGILFVEMQHDHLIERKEAFGRQKLSESNFNYWINFSK